MNYPRETRSAWSSRTFLSGEVWLASFVATSDVPVRLREEMTAAIANQHAYEVVHRMICPDPMLRTVRFHAEPQFNGTDRST